jgi:hypothetical protein
MSLTPTTPLKLARNLCCDNRKKGAPAHQTAIAVAATAADLNISNPYLFIN